MIIPPGNIKVPKMRTELPDIPGSGAQDSGTEPPPSAVARWK